MDIVVIAPYTQYRRQTANLALLQHVCQHKFCKKRADARIALLIPGHCKMCRNAKQKSAILIRNSTPTAFAALVQSSLRFLMTVKLAFQKSVIPVRFCKTMESAMIALPIRNHSKMGVYANRNHVL